MNSASQWLQTGLESFKAGRFAHAKACFDRVLSLEPERADALHLAGLASAALGESEGAVELIRRALAAAPAMRAAEINLANILGKLGRIEESIAGYRRALALPPEDASTHFLLAAALQRHGDLDAACEHYRRALTLRPAFPDAALNLGAALTTRGDFIEAIGLLRQVLAWVPDDFEALVNLGVALHKSGSAHEALPPLLRARELRPEAPEVWFNLGVAQSAQGAIDAAIESWRQAIALNPRYVEPRTRLGDELGARGRFEEALRYLSEAAALEPASHAVRAKLALARCGVCDWSEASTYRETLLVPALVSADPAVSLDPFLAMMLPVGASEAELLVLARRHAALWAREPALPAVSPSLPSGPLSIGYLSADFHDHATAHLMAGMFACHDRKRVRIFTYSYGVDDGSEYRDRIRRDSDVFRDLRGLSDQAAAQLIRADGVDLLVDLKGYTYGARPGILARRPAPVQVQYLGYPGSMGAPFIDGVVADAGVVPPGAEAHYAETVVCLPDCYQVNDDMQKVASDDPGREAHGLPAEGFVFCCFNNNYKIEPTVFGVWMDILRETPGSVLWLFRNHALAERNLRSAAAAAGIAPERLVFADKLPKDRHLARHRHADLFLDTFQYNAHTTASDALWAGVPLLTCRGDTFASRVAASLLAAVGLPDMVAPDVPGYRERAVSFASNPVLIAEVRNRLAANIPKAALFDTRRFTRNFEDVCAAFHTACVAGAAPRRMTPIPPGND